MAAAGLVACSIRSSARGWIALRFWRTAMDDDDRPSMERTFTLDEANAAVAQLRPVVEQLVEHRRRLDAAQRRQAQLLTRIAGDGGDRQPRELGDVAAPGQAAAEVIGGGAERVHDAGWQVQRLGGRRLACTPV